MQVAGESSGEPLHDEGCRLDAEGEPGEAKLSTVEAVCGEAVRT